MAWLDKTALALTAMGAINWGFYALSTKAELIHYLQVGWLIKTIYIIIGICGIYALIKAFQ